MGCGPGREDKEISREARVRKQGTAASSHLIWCLPKLSFPRIALRLNLLVTGMIVFSGDCSTRFCSL